MMRSFFLFVFCTIVFIPLSAQSNNSICIEGRVFATEGMSVETLILTAINPSDSTVIAYCLTDEEGRYCLKFTTELHEVLIRISGFNIKHEVQKINVKNQTLDFKVQEESIALREVQIKAQKLWGNRDTLNYLVAAYIKEHDRTIGDVLKQLPGISIEEGVIKYQGVSINHFYIENMDVLQGRYSIATDGLKADEVAMVQVMENHEHVKALKDQVPPESAAINLKLKDKAKGTWKRDFNLGLGYDDGLLWNSDINLMYFGKQRQHVFFYGNENIGKGENRLTQHYDKDELGANIQTGILTPSSSPVGTTLRNNRHSLNISNLNKLNETTQLHYNLTYIHDIQRRSFYQQTAYILPDANIRILSEDISSRHTTNDAAIQLVYEENKEKHFLHNTLNLIGQWTEANGTVLSDDERIRQFSHNRNFGLSNLTRWVHRTDKGGGFEFSSRSLIQATPQLLSVNDNMQARQEVEITRVGSTNKFSLLKDLRHHRWTIVPTASINMDYVGLKSLLKAAISDNGRMDYLSVKGHLGATLRYVKNDFRMTYNLPLVLSYTQVGSKTDATRIYFSPSLNFLWRTTDSWTLAGGATYNMEQTGWNQLITTCIMSNYRTLNRYVPDLSDSHSASANIKITYKDLLNEFFAYFQGTISHSWSDVIYSTTIDENAHTVMAALKMPNHSDMYLLTGNCSKDFDWRKARLEATVSFRHNESRILRQSVATDFYSNICSVYVHAAANIVQPLRIDYNYEYSLLRTHSTDYVHTIRTFDQGVSLNASFYSNRLLVNMSVHHTHNSAFQGKKDYAFMDASLTFRTKGKQEIVLKAGNLFNTRTFVSRSNTDLAECFTIYHLRPRSVMLTVHFDLFKR